MNSEGWVCSYSNFTREGSYKACSSSFAGVRKNKRAPLGGLHCRKMLAFCCQKQFSSTLDNMRNTATWPNGWPWMSQSRKFPKRTSSKQTSGLFEPGPWLTTHWLQEPHQESHKLKVLLCIYWELLQLLGMLTELHCGGRALEGLLIFLTYRWERKWSFTLGRVE